MRINRSLLNWGVFLIALGGVPLAVEQGWADADIAADLWRVWPLILVGIGLGLILRWTPAAWLGGAIVAGTFGLIFGALIAGGVGNACVGFSAGESRTTTESGAASGDAFALEFEISCGEFNVGRGTAGEWSVVAEHGPEDPPTIEGSPAGLTLDQGSDPSGFFALTEQHRTDWTIRLPAITSLSTGMTLNAATGTVDFGSGPVSRVGGTYNASDVALDLGEATTTQPIDLGLTFNFSSGELTLSAGAITGGMTLNVSSLTVCLPSAAEARLELESAVLSSHNFGESGLTEVSGGWQTESYATAAGRVDLSITSTVSSITLERPEVCP
jgi:hypothetical protein